MGAFSELTTYSARRMEEFLAIVAKISDEHFQLLCHVEKVLVQFSFESERAWIIQCHTLTPCVIQIQEMGSSVG